MSRIVQPMGPIVMRLVVESDAKARSQVRLEKMNAAGAMAPSVIIETEYMLMLVNMLGSAISQLHQRTTGIRSATGAREKTTD